MEKTSSYRSKSKTTKNNWSKECSGIYIEFKNFVGICCKGILTLQKTRFGGPGKPSFWSVLDYGFYGFLWVLMSFYKFATFFFADCGEAASSKTRFC